jgi:hypothetical protein
MKATRRNHLAALGGTLLAASSLSAAGPDQHRPAGDGAGDVLYGHGLVWNRELSGVAGELKLAFDLRVNVETGVGFGTANDPVFPDWNVHFSIDTVERKRLRRGETRVLLKGVVTQAANASHLGLPVRIAAQTEGDATAIVIAIGDQVFMGAGLVVIAIIAWLIPLLLPAVQ